MNDDDCVHWNDLEALQRLIEAQIHSRDVRMNGLDEAIKVAAQERKIKDEELNNVRFRFVDKEAFEEYTKSQQSMKETERIERQRQFRTLAIGLGAMALTVLGIIVQILNK